MSVPDKKRRGIPWADKEDVRTADLFLLVFLHTDVCVSQKKSWKPPRCSTGVMMSMIKIFIIPVENNHFVLFCFVFSSVFFNVRRLYVSVLPSCMSCQPSPAIRSFRKILVGFAQPQRPFIFEKISALERSYEDDMNCGNTNF